MGGPSIGQLLAKNRDFPVKSELVFLSCNHRKMMAGELQDSVKNTFFTTYRKSKDTQNSRGKLP
jgi:hypothetical protein